MPPFFSKFKRFFNWFRNPKIASSDLSDKRFQKDSQQWLNRLKPEEHTAGRQILKSIAEAIGSQSKQIDLSKFPVSQFPTTLIVQWLPYLESANFSHHRIQSVAFLNQLIYLKELKMNHCQIKKMNNVCLPILEHLELSDNNLTNLEGCDFNKVITLKLDNNDLKTFKDLSKLFPKLKNISLKNNQITSYKGVNSLANQIGKPLHNINMSKLSKYHKKTFHHLNQANRKNSYSRGSNSNNIPHMISSYPNVNNTPGHSSKHLLTTATAALNVLTSPAGNRTTPRS